MLLDLALEVSKLGVQLVELVLLILDCFIGVLHLAASSLDLVLFVFSKRLD